MLCYPSLPLLPRRLCGIGATGPGHLGARAGRLDALLGGGSGLSGAKQVALAVFLCPRSSQAAAREVRLGTCFTVRVDWSGLPWWRPLRSALSAGHGCNHVVIALSADHGPRVRGRRAWSLHGRVRRCSEGEPTPLNNPCGLWNDRAACVKCALTCVEGTLALCTVGTSCIERLATVSAVDTRLLHFRHATRDGRLGRPPLCLPTAEWAYDGEARPKSSAGRRGPHPVLEARLGSWPVPMPELDASPLWPTGRRGGSPTRWPWALP